MKVYENVQEKRGHKPPLKPKVSVETRWNSSIDETKRANQIMGDICETNKILLWPSGDDYNLLTPQEKNSNDLSRLTYTEKDKTIIRQYEGAAAPAKVFSLFTQDRKLSWSYILYEARLVISTSREVLLLSYKVCYIIQLVISFVLLDTHLILCQMFLS